MKTFLMTALVISAMAFSGVIFAQDADFLARLNVYSIAILPPLGADVPTAARAMSGDLFASKFKIREAAIRVVGADETVSMMQSKSTMSDYSVFVTTLSQAGIVNTDALKKITQAVDTDAVLLINVLNYQEEKGSWWYGKGGQNVSRIQYTLFRASDGSKV
jgi:hypothetical protein